MLFWGSYHVKINSLCDKVNANKLIICASSPFHPFYQFIKMFKNDQGEFHENINLNYITESVEMLATKCVGDMFEILMRVFNISLNITFADTNIHEMSPRSEFCFQHQKYVTSYESPTSSNHQHHCGTRID